MYEELEEEIREYGEYLGKGISREAYRYQGKVYKLLRDPEDTYQTSAEQDVYVYLPEKFKQFFPNPKWLGADIIEMDEVIIAEHIVPWGDPEVSSQASYLSDRTHQYLAYTDILEFLVYTNLTHLLPTLEEFTNWLLENNFNCRDLFNNAENYGIREGQLKFVDWGLSI